MEKRTISFWAQVVAVLWIGGFSAYRFVLYPETITVSDIILSGFAIAASFSPVFISLWIDKIIGKGGNNG